jgi:hypothetical protein
MALLQYFQAAFNSGELSPHLLGRLDTSKYLPGAKTILNWLVRPEGSVTRRPGTRYVSEVMDSSVQSRLIRFVYSNEQAYIIELGDERARFFKDEAAVLAHTKTFVDGDVSVANNEVNIADHFYADEQGPFQLETTGTLPAGLSTGTDYYIVNSGLTGTPAADYLGFSLTPGGAKVPITAAAGGGTHSIVPGSDTRHELVMPYTAAELSAVQIAQSADVLFIAHPSHHPQTLTRTGHTSWTIADMDLQDGPYLGLRELTPGNPHPVVGNFLTPSGTIGTQTVSASQINTFDAARDVNRMLRIRDDTGTDWGSARITAVADDQNATIVIKKDLANTTPSHIWHMGAWYSGNYPRAVEFHQQRLGFASTVLEPERIDMSETGDYIDYAPSETDGSVVDSNALSYQIAGAGEVQLVRWMHAMRHLMVATNSALWPVLAASVDEAVTPTNVHVTRAGRVGASAVQPIASSNGVIYASSTGKKIFFASYDLTLDSYDPDDLTLLSDHITGTGVAYLAHAFEPFGIVWACRNDGVLAGLTFERSQQVWAWHRQILGGSFGGSHPVVESIDAIPSPNADHDQLWLSVKRTIDGSTVRYIEFLEETFSDAHDIESAFFVDSGLSLDAPADISGATQADPVVVTATAHGFSNGDEVRITHVEGMTQLNGLSFTVANKTANTFELSGVDGTGYSEYIAGGEVRLKVSTVSGADHLEGETVAVLADGAVQPAQVVSGGQISLDPKASEVHLGLAYNSDLETLPLALQDERGVIQGRRHRPTHADIRLHRTLGLKVGDSADDLREIPFRTPLDLMDAPAPLYTGLLEGERLPHGAGVDPTLYFRKDDPLPATILAVIPTVGVSPR